MVLMKFFFQAAEVIHEISSDKTGAHTGLSANI